jgi:hypothetical protein
VIKRIRRWLEVWRQVRIESEKQFVRLEWAAQAERHRVQQENLARLVESARCNTVCCLPPPDEVERIVRECGA